MDSNVKFIINCTKKIQAWNGPIIMQLFHVLVLQCLASHTSDNTSNKMSFFINHLKYKILPVNIFILIKHFIV